MRKNEITGDVSAEVVGLAAKHLSARQIAQRVGISVSSVYRILRGADGIVNPEIVRRAIDVFESRTIALGWLRQPIPAFGGISPREMLRRPGGEELVLAELVRIEHGVTS